MHTHTYIQRTSRVATSVLSGRLVLAKVQADQKKRIITGSEYSSPPPSQTRFCRKATPLACKRNTLDKKTSLNISFGIRGSIIFLLKFHEKCCFFKPIFLRKFWDCSGAKGCKSCRAWKMLSNAYFLAKFRFDTAENKTMQEMRHAMVRRVQDAPSLVVLWVRTDV